MRLWSIHPQYLDTQGLVALWREALLAQAVILNLTKGYKNHPQLYRFQQSADPAGAIAQYLQEVFLNAQKRGYKFAGEKVGKIKEKININVHDKQVSYEWQHLQNKLSIRSPKVLLLWRDVKTPQVHPQFVIVKGEIEVWEKL